MGNIEYEAIVKIDGEVVGRIQSFSLESLEEKLYSLEMRAKKIIEEKNKDTI